jgi:integrase
MARDLLKRCPCPPDRWSKCAHGWYVRKQVDGTRASISLDQVVDHARVRLVSQAEQLRDAVIGALRERPAETPIVPYLRAHPDVQAFRIDGRTPAPRPGPSSAAAIALRDVCANYLFTLTSDPDRRPKHLANVQSLIGQLVAWPVPAGVPGMRAGVVLGTLPVGLVSDDVLEAFLLALARAGKSVSTRNKYLDFLRRLGRWAARKGYRPRPWLAVGETDLKRRAETRRRRRLQPGEEVRLLAVAGPLLHALIVAGLETGARLGELLRVTWAAVDLPQARLELRDLKDPTRVRQVPIPPRLLAVLAMRQTGPDGRPLERDAYVFGNEVGERVASVYTAWQNVVLKAHGHPVVRDRTTHALTPASVAAYHAADLVFHDLRHEAASRWMDQHVPVSTIQAWLGHQSLAMLSVYAHVTWEESQRAMAAFQVAQQRAAQEKVAQSGTNAPGSGAKRKSRKDGKYLSH